MRLLNGLSDGDTLACGQPVGLHNHRPPDFLYVTMRLPSGGEPLPLGARHPCPLHHLFGKYLG